MIAVGPDLWHDPSALIIGGLAVVGSIVALIAYSVGHAHGIRDVERWQRRRP